ncbi:uncharacterized protein FTJAE_139 [Fusarium tjaetaba]|uniref:NAD(P)-binding domain-containing protein n=1 Tax=Fusarium tjaetaba TaxID=1567544 RepID=A0A8H5W6X3_9HYPO|nr:uncharacterized protein FTJAE_139 [Fusarium tjaetaba]KAF5651392.1 hypothetical protein FTJAE_139 [Fusarium tjaetaba]
MANSPTLHSTLSVVSGQLCFGSLHNIWFGSSAPTQGLLVAPPHPSGTVQAHSINYNICAQNGIWNVYKLVISETSDAVAWFVAHADIDPRQEVDKILRISGSPYEPDHGSTMNNDITSQAGVFVVNRYDWGYYNERCLDEIGEGQEEGDDDVLANSNSLGLVDRSVAQELVQRWKSQRPSLRDSAESGVWLYIPHGEYMFGRFGFDDTRTAARSFLFFSAGTEFTRTSFLGIPGTLREYTTPQERFERQLREGVGFSGMEIVKDMIFYQHVSPPPVSELLGLYHPSDYLLRKQEFEALRSYCEEQASSSGMGPTIHGFIDPWKQLLFDLINEMTLSYLEHFILPHLGGDDVAEIAEILFPDYEKKIRPISLDVASYRHFTEPDQDPIPDFNESHVCVLIRQFLESRSQDKPMVFRDNAIKGICRVLGYIVTEVFELANGVATDSQHNKILPCHVRQAVLLDEDILRLVCFSKALWEGSPEDSQYCARKVFLLISIMKLIVVGATGYIGAGILRQALARSDVTSVVAVTRRPLEQTATKLQNVIVPDYGAYSPAAKEAFAGAGACIWTVGVTPSHAFRMDPEEVRKVCQDYTMLGLEAMRSSGLARPFRVAYLSAVAVPRDINKTMWFAPKFRRIRGTAENQVVEFAKASDGAVEAVIAKPGHVPVQGGILVTALTAISRPLGIGVTEAVVLDDLAIALVDQVVHGIEKDPLWPADLNRLAQQVKDKKGLK